MPARIGRLAVEREVEEVVMKSTAQYWRPVWEALEQHWRSRRRARDGEPRLSGTLHLAQAQSNQGPAALAAQRLRATPEPDVPVC